MLTSGKSAKRILDRNLKGSPVEQEIRRIMPTSVSEKPLPARVPAGMDRTAEGLMRRRKFLSDMSISLDQLSGDAPDIEPERLAGNIENLIGYSRIPVGVIGPLRINGANANGDFYVPLATSEGALVASCNRGAFVISQAGGASVLCLTESVSRAPCFVFRTIADSARFLSWLIGVFDQLKAAAATTTRHGELIDMRPAVIGKEVYVNFEYLTGDASGQNMVTIATEAVCIYIQENTPVKPLKWYLEGNLSGDKKATMMSFLYTRGKKVVAEAILPAKLIKKFMHVTPKDMMGYWHVSLLGGAQSGSIGVQGHYANALAALFIACGQDAACVSEASIGITRMDITEDDNLYVSVTLPNLIVGTVGGGTHLPTARECLAMMDCVGNDRARKFAEICAATVLAGEISIIAALASGEFGAAHAKYGRKK